ncbi:MAG: DUF6607 family protein [Brevundimonas sp.]
MRPIAITLAAVLAAVTPALAAAPAFAQAGTATAETAEARFERDRQAILSQAGDFRVRFDMRETVPFQDGYEPLDEKLSGGNEIVRVVYDDGDRISLQHILVMDHEGQTFVIKHWRQDWAYEPATVLTYAGPDRWTLTPVDEATRRGAWSQTVWQTDDSPRYGGVGRWSHDNGMAQWTSDETTRPLARRDAVRDPIYDRYVGTNRHVLTPFGWAHLQDNVKLGQAQGDASGLVAYVQEDVVNTYRRWDGFDPAAGDAYWAATSDYWAAVRGFWDAAIVAGNGVTVEEEPNNGAVTGPTLMGLADRIEDGEITTEAAIAEARRTIAEATGAAL